MSGEAFRIAQSRPSALTATELCVIAGIRPARAALQLAQPQFHCGSPPPAPAPSRMIFMMSLTKRPRPRVSDGAVHDA